MPLTISASILLVTAIVIAALLATTIVKSTLEIAMSARIKVVKVIDPILVTTLDKNNATCVSVILRADVTYISAKELEIAYYTEKTVSVNVTKKYGIVYRDPLTKTIVLNIDGATQTVSANKIANTVCDLLETNEAAIIWFCAEEQTEICPGLPVLLVLKTPQAEKLIVEIKSPKTPSVKIRAR